MIGRPEPHEAAPYYFRYIDQISSDNIVGLLARLGERLTGSAKEINR